MSDDPDRGETCIVCGRSTEGDRGFAHRYLDGRPFAVCGPLCLQLFERASDRFARGDRPQTMLQQLLDEITWRDSRW
ncbi:MAG: hypothetical protein HY302_06600 [Opitutae bacterium]|nr:hypothetical protein [Opitutae bacterium]